MTAAGAQGRSEGRTGLQAEELLVLERQLAAEGAPAYVELLHQEALLVVPGAVLDRSRCIDAIAASPGWDDIDLAPLWYFRNGRSAVHTYRFTGRRGGETYRAVMSSSWVDTPEGARLIHHQQTPER
ncbi:hypothetical protein BN1051_01116 [Arthrobacter saudimassiliensis]|uniref:DUF4440 domain-containing protein n=1 Tax=Arthrobacter saudimassiliensis TaxID=1461584 RepID=A0A078MKD7_9MICC|nr:hypothetical protein BN1051_01116 [Arthrobacter saudimassiliensis]